MPGNQLNPYGNRYSGGGGGGSGSGVTSYNTRTGAVTAQASDVEGLFTAAGQVFVGTGSGTGVLSSTTQGSPTLLSLGVGTTFSGFANGIQVANGLYIYAGATSNSFAGIQFDSATNNIALQVGSGGSVICDAPMSMQSNKITSLANGTVSTDAAAFGQLSNGQIQGQILATKLYAPATASVDSLTASLAAVDTTNMTLAFTVPASGIVDVTVEMFGGSTTGSGNSTVWAALLNHTGGAQLGFTQIIILNAFAATLATFHETLRFHLTGLTPGALQVDFAAAVSTTGGASATINAQGVTGLSATSSPFLMQAISSV